MEEEFCKTIARETGLYYYRARYYNPYIGRFMQTDPVGYGYGYCGNNLLSMVDPSGAVYYEWTNNDEEGFTCTVYNDDGTIYQRDGEDLVEDFCDIDACLDWLESLDDLLTDDWIREQVGFKLSGGDVDDEFLFWRLQALMELNGLFRIMINNMEKGGFNLTIIRACLRRFLWWMLRYKKREGDLCNALGKPHTKSDIRNVTFFKDVPWEFVGEPVTNLILPALRFSKNKDLSSYCAYLSKKQLYLLPIKFYPKTSQATLGNKPLRNSFKRLCVRHIISHWHDT
jgi:hypothetical protein